MDMATYLAQTNALLQNPLPSTPLYAQSDLVNYINLGRQQLALDTECIRYSAFTNIISGTQTYAFTSITSVPTGIGSLISILNVAPQASSTYQFAAPRPWPWFFRFYVQNASSFSTGTPTVWSVQGEGAGGVLYLYPIPNVSVLYIIDGIYTPTNLLTSGGPPEVIPYPFTDAVPYYAAYYAYMSTQRQDDADRMKMRYKEFAQRGRQLSTPTVLPNNYPGGQGTIGASSRTNLSGPAGGGGGQ
jgi:hypothetical protein